METMNFKASDGRWYEIEYTHEACDYSDEINDDLLTVYDQFGLQITEETNRKVMRQIKRYLTLKFLGDDQEEQEYNPQTFHALGW